MSIIKKYWDILSGLFTGILLAFLARFKLEKIQLAYSIIILILVCIGVMRIIKQAVEKQRHTRAREPTIIDSMVDGQNSIKAISLAQTPTREGEKIGEMIITILKGEKNIMKKFKTFFSKFKGYMLTVALAILTIVEMYGGFINELFGGVLAIKGIAVLPIATLGCTVVVGILSNGYTKEQIDRIKALFSTATTNELVLAEIKKTIKEKTAQLAQFNKVLTTQETALAAYENELTTLENTLSAKKEMNAMIPQLASIEDVQLAANAVVECRNKVAKQKDEIAKTNATIKTLTTNINALKSQI